LRHDLHAVGRLPRFSGRVLNFAPVTTSEEQCRCRRAIREKPAQIGRFRPLQPPWIRLNTRGCVSTCSGRCANINHPAWATTVHRGIETAPALGHR
jgi:hypothetical protein